MAAYVPPDQLKDWLGLTDAEDDSKVAAASSGAQAAIDAWLGRNFNLDTEDTSRYYRPLTSGLCLIDDATSITTVAIDTAQTGSWGTTLDASDWFAAPVGNIGPSGKPGWPYTEIVSPNIGRFQCTARPFVKVTGKFGWPQIPDDILLAVRLYAAELFKLNEAPLGTSWTENGNDPIIGSNRPLASLLMPYHKSVGVA